MPVEDSPVHSSTRIDSSHRYGCHNRKGFKAGYMAPDGYALGMLGNTREIYMSFVAHRMSQECRYDHSLTDPCCTGCKWRGSGEAYDQMVRERGK